MITHTTYIRVSYAATDQMGYAYYGRYAEYLEIARTDLVRALGLPYKTVEERGIWMPVSELNVEYLRPVHYDDRLTIRTTVKERPGVRFIFHSEIMNGEGTVCARGRVTLVFLDAARQRPVRMPDFIAEAVDAHWGQEIAPNP